MKQTREIKRLKSELKTIQNHAQALKIQVSNKQREYHNKLNTIKCLEKQINDFEKDKIIRVSEHAIVRYFERILGFNISEIEKEIVNDDVLSLVNQLGGSGKYPNRDFSVVMKNHTVVTIV